jgi:hypothetical protein
VRSLAEDRDERHFAGFAKPALTLCDTQRAVAVSFGHHVRWPSWRFARKNEKIKTRKRKSFPDCGRYKRKFCDCDINLGVWSA